MKLVPVYAGDAPLVGAKTPPGTVEISAEKQQLIGVRIGTAEITAGADMVRATGKVAIDETRVSHVHSRTEGWIDKVYADFTGDLVRKGQPLVTLYSPELLASQQEYLLAIKARDLMRNSPIQGAASDAASLVEASRRRLQLWDLSERQIEELERSQKPVTNTTLYAPASGYVMTRNAFPNQKIVPETELYTVVDLSRVWVLASIFEYQAPLVHVGQAAVVSLPYGGGRSWSARVSYLQPQVDAQTRTIQVRIELPNPGLALKPEMFVNVELRSPGAALLTVPAEAVLDTGLKKTIFVDLGNGHFEPREVETGERIGDRVAVLKGLVAGERLVVSGNFLMNSESQLKAAAGATHD
jgi:RND family efflux transporter MFP subunit